MNFVLGYALSMASKFLKPVLKTPSVGVCGTSWKWIRIGTFSSAASSYIRRSSGPAASTWNLISPSPVAPLFTALVSRSAASGLVMSVLANQARNRPGYLRFQRLHLLRGVGARQRLGIGDSGAVEMRDVGLRRRPQMVVAIHDRRARPGDRSRGLREVHTGRGEHPGDGLGELPSIDHGHSLSQGK